MNTLLAWAKCFLATSGVYPGLYDLLDTPRLDFLAAQLHLRDSTLPRPLLHRSRGPPTIRSEYVALQPHLAPPPTQSSVRLSHAPSVLLHVSLSCDQSVHHPDSTHSLSITPQVSRTVRPSPDSPSVIPARPSPESSVPPPVTPSMTRPSATPPVSLAQRQSDRPSPSDRLYTIRPRLSGCPTSHRLHDTPTSPSDHPPPSQRLYDTPTRPSDHPPPSQRLYDTPPVRQTIRHRHTICTTHQSVRQPVRQPPTV